MKGRKLGIMVAAVVLLGGFGYLAYGGIGDNLVYFLTPSELEAKGASAVDAPVRLGGQVVPGSVQWNAEAVDLRFRMTDGRGTLEVRARKAPPQMFRDGQGVVVEGKLTRAGIFDASNLMVKHSNEYKPPAHGHEPQEMYRSLMKTGTT